MPISPRWRVTVCRWSLEGAREILLARIDSVSQSEIGFDLTNQGLSIAFVVPYHNSMSVTGSLTIGKRG